MDRRSEPRRGRGGRHRGQDPSGGGRGRGRSNAGRGGGAGGRAPSGGQAASGPFRAPLVVPKKLGSGPVELVTYALDLTQPVKQRVKALTLFQHAIGTPAGKQHAIQRADRLVEDLIRCLKCDETEIGQATVSCVGALAVALAGAANGACASLKTDPLSFLVDTLLRTLTPSESRDALSARQQVAMLHATHELLKHLPPAVQWRKASEIVVTVRAALMSTDTSPEALIPALELLLSALKHCHTLPGGGGDDVMRGLHFVAAHCRLPSQGRPLLARAVHAVTAGWATSGPAFRRMQCALLKDLGVTCASSNTDGPLTRLTPVLGLAACCAPMLLRGLAEDRNTGALHAAEALQAFSEAVRQPWITSAGALELHGHASRFMTAALKPATANQAKGTGPAQLQRPSAADASSAVRAEVELRVLQDEQGLATALAALGISPGGEKVELRLRLMPSYGEKGPLAALSDQGKDGTSTVVPDTCWELLRVAVELTTSILHKDGIVISSDAVGLLSTAVLNWLLLLPRDCRFPSDLIEALVALACPQDVPQVPDIRKMATPAHSQSVAKLYVHLAAHVEAVHAVLLAELRQWSTIKEEIVLFDVNVLSAALKAMRNSGVDSPVTPTMAQNAMGVAIDIAASGGPKVNGAALQWAGQLAVHGALVEPSRAAISAVLDVSYKLWGQNPTSMLREVVVGVASTLATSSDFVPTLADRSDLAWGLCAMAVQAQHTESEAMAAKAAHLLQKIALPAALLAMAPKFKPPVVAPPSPLVKAAAWQGRQYTFSDSQMVQILDYVAGGAPVAVLLGGAHYKKEAAGVADTWLPQLLHDLSPLPKSEETASYAGEICTIE